MKLSSISIVVSLLLTTLLLACGQEDNRVYKDFYKRLQEDEAYIGFFAAEKKYISELTEEDREL